jgi:GMP synthase (glutamine-hydrolysing)
MMMEEIKAEDLEPEKFVKEKIEEILAIIGSNSAINALSGGVDSSTVTLLGHKALGDRLKTYFIENGLMRKGEPEQVVSLFEKLGVKVEIVDAQKQFFNALKSITDPEEKREAITQTFYREVFGKLVSESEAKFLLQGTILTDVEETVAGIKRQHNILEQLGIDPEREFGYKIVEPLIQLRKEGVRKVAEVLGLPASVYNRSPFPGPALAARVIGEVTLERIAVVRKATAIVEEELKDTGAFQSMAILHEDRVTGMRVGKREYGMQIEIRSWESKDARTATPTRLSYDILDRLSERITTEVPGVISVTYNITKKPPSTMEVV